MNPVLSPSEAIALLVDGTFLLAGRVVFADREHLIIADGLAQLMLKTSKNTERQGCSPGDLVKIFGTKSSAAWSLLELIEIAKYPEPTHSSEFGRLATTRRTAGLVARSAAKRAVRQYFEKHNFIEVDTPSAVPCPGLDANVSSWGGVQRGKQELFLITSPEFHMKRLLAGGMTKIYQICHCFRSEERGPWHQPEFSMVEWYRAHCSWQETMLDTQELLRGVATAIGNDVTQRLVEQSFDSITVSQAFADYAFEPDALDLAVSCEAKFFELLVDRVEPALARHERPIFLTHYPLSQAALAQPCVEMPGTAERYELYFRGHELCNGYTELTSEADQRERFMAELKRRDTSGETKYPIDERFLAALASGMPPASGNAMGFDRLVAAVLDCDELLPVLAFSDDED